ncbi:tRNA lysidine(34) synthetase TilS [Butyrivibrio sp. WCD3002]|uniref:tRNA lysidine(34) synthetase TilS n=1 Tax=Butyrivibrio sp. WCD3002 TaxID=1280676 RepID=UPI0004153F5E|nr:tRNA lysidine(34) synthetase TilS [Butyrivibrio sp. WCD3002]
MDKHLSKVKKFIADEELIKGDEIVLAGVSGGADSVCLFNMLCELSADLGFKLAVIHINHMIRQEAGEDAAFVEKLCEDNRISFFKKDIDIPGLSKTTDASEEELARNERYKAFEEVATMLSERYGKKVIIATAHNANDQAETMLHNLFRGSGIKGLSGIKVLSFRGDFELIRPLLVLERDEIEEYLTEKGLKWCTDKTNETDDYTRNRIRHNILPVAKEQINNGAIRHAAKAAEYISEVDDYIDEQADAVFFDIAAMSQGGIIINCESCAMQHKVVRSRILMKAIKFIVPHIKDIQSVHLSELDNMLQRTEGSESLSLPYGINATREYGDLILTLGDISPNEQEDADAEGFFIDKDHLEAGGDHVFNIPGLGKVNFKLFLYKSDMKIPTLEYTKWFDYDKISNSMQFRRRETGDVIEIGDGTKTLKKFMIDEKIPAKSREELFVLFDDKDVIWIPGYRISSKFKVDSDTARILEVKLISD